MFSALGIVLHAVCIGVAEGMSSQPATVAWKEELCGGDVAVSNKVLGEVRKGYCVMHNDIHRDQRMNFLACVLWDHCLTSTHSMAGYAFNVETSTARSMFCFLGRGCVEVVRLKLAATP